ncbi:hypothetical protein [Actinoplanes sp. NPDC051859]|uniref:hypothetical protein n=1 Tax=Actinoplanes sp. NPDC051859 TaxID=3363909 RepID=UPI0037AB89D3
MNVVTVTEPVSVRRWRWSDAVRILLAVLWLVAAATTWWTTPRQVDFADAQAALADGQVTVFQWGDLWDGSEDLWFGDPQLTSSGSRGPLFAWRTPDHRVFWVETGEFHQSSASDPADGDYASAGAALLGHDLDTRGLGHRSGNLTPLHTLVAVLTIVLGLTFLVVLVNGAAPRRATRWYWFWIGLLVPYGIGLLFWLGRDRSAGAEQRASGFVGLGLGVAAMLFGGILMVGLNAVFGDRWVPLSP